jgi:hypothetical protein
MAIVSDAPRWSPRVLAAVAFGGGGALLAALWFGPVLIGGHGDGVGWLLYVVLPGLAGAASGALLGSPLARPAGRGREGAAMGRGALVGAAALLVYAPLYAAVVKWAEPGWTSVLGLSLLVLEFGGIAVGWALVLVGGVVGWGLYRWALRRARAAT